jgi:hypothetical protein
LLHRSVHFIFFFNFGANFGFFFLFLHSTLSRLGTGEYCNLRFNVPEKNVGETQCILCLVDGKVYLLPVSERHETRLNNRPISERVALRDNDVVSIGKRLFWIQITGGVNVVRNCRFDRPELPEANDADAGSFVNERPTRDILMTPVKVAEAAAASTHAAVHAATHAAMVAGAGRGSHIGEVSTTVVRDGDSFRATSTVVVRVDVDDEAPAPVVESAAFDTAAAAVSAAAAPEQFMSPPVTRVAPTPVESALPPPKQNKRKMSSTSVASVRRQQDGARQLQRSYKKEQDREEQQLAEEQRALEQVSSRRRTVSTSPAPQRRAATDTAATSAPVEVVENDQNSHSTIKISFELHKLSTNSSRFARQWAPVGTRREKKAPHMLQF